MNVRYTIVTSVIGNLKNYFSVILLAVHMDKLWCIVNDNVILLVAAMYVRMITDSVIL